TASVCPRRELVVQAVPGGGWRLVNAAMLNCVESAGANAALFVQSMIERLPGAVGRITYVGDELLLFPADRATTPVVMVVTSGPDGLNFSPSADPADIPA